MSTTQFTDGVLIAGSEDEVQLRIAGNIVQNAPLQTWENDNSEVLAQVTAEGRLTLGDDLGAATPDALLEAHRATSSSYPMRAFHALGQVAGALSDAVHWVVHELELRGNEAISGLHSTLRVRLHHQSTGDSSEADLVAGDVQANNESGSPSTRVGHLTGLRAGVHNAEAGYVDEAIGLQVTLVNDNVDEEDVAIKSAYGIRIEDVEQGASNYALHSGVGTVHLGDALELPIFTTSPADNPPADYFKMYFKLEEGSPVLYVKDANGVEHTVIGGSGGGLPISQDYVSIKVTNRSDSTSAVGEVGVLLRGEWYRLGDFKGMAYYRHRHQNGEGIAERAWDYLRCGVALEVVATDGDLYVAVDGRVTVIGDGVIDVGDLVKLSGTTPGRFINGVMSNDYAVGHAVTACSGAGELFTMNLWTGGQNTSRGSFVIGDALLGKLDGIGVLG